MTTDSIPQNDSSNITSPFSKRYWLFIWYDDSERDRYEDPIPLEGFIGSFATLEDAKNPENLGEMWNFYSRANIYDSFSQKTVGHMAGNYGFWSNNG